jgi:sarcosine oxidase
MTHDVIVIGLGGMGSAAAAELARRGQRVLGLERFGPAHDRGSSHGESRIIRQAYFEDPAYVPLLLRAYPLWQRLQRDAKAELLEITGGLMIGPPDSRTVAGSRASAERWGLDHELLDASELRRRYPAFAPEPGVLALYEAAAGFLRPEAAVAANLHLADKTGAELRFDTPVSGWEAHGHGVRVTTEGEVFEAGALVVAGGAWAPHLLADLGLPLEIERQVQYWFSPIGGVEPFLRHPIWIWEADDGQRPYGFPAHEPSRGVKTALFHVGERCTPETIDRTVHPEEVERMRGYLAAHVPPLAGRLLDARTCMYTNTPDEHFVLASHPLHPQVAIAAGFSGHGFKFVPVIGEILADLVTGGSTAHPIDLFTPARFGPRASLSP